MFYEHLKNEAMIKNTIKLADALAQGYTYFGISDLSEFQVARDLNAEELERAISQHPDHRMQLFVKDGFTPSGIDELALRDIVEDHMKCQYMDESGNDDDSDVSAALRTVDFAAFAKSITEAMATMPKYYDFDGLYVIP